METPTFDINNLIKTDLERSGLTLEDIHGRVATHAELSILNLGAATQGYIIPYETLDGQPLDFYRMKVLIPEGMYRQPGDTKTHVYFPPALPLITNGIPVHRIQEQQDTSPLPGKNFIIITEGEKKASIVAKMGIPCVAVGGIWAWRNRSVSIPANVEGIKPYPSAKNKVYKLTGDEHVSDSDRASLAEGLSQLIEYIRRMHCSVIIIFDSDVKEETKINVRNASAEFAAELRFNGVAHNLIREIILPTKPGQKTGIDDFVMEHGKEKLLKVVEESLIPHRAHLYLPKHGNAKKRINNALDNDYKLSRRDIIKTGYMVLADLDSRGSRYKNRLTKDPYYFDRSTKKLIGSAIDKETYRMEFGKLLHERYGLGIDDQRFLNRLNTLMNSEEPIPEIDVHKTVITRGDNVYFRLNDSLYARVSPDTPTYNDLKPELEIFENGYDGILFEAQDHLIDPFSSLGNLDIEAVKGFYHQHKGVTITKENRWQPESWWRPTLKSVNLASHEKGASQSMAESSDLLVELLYYVSPWLNRWKGLQLPIEMVIGEAGSGKSSLCELRLMIINGTPSLRNPPTDIRDWFSSIASTGGLHVTDNVQFSDKVLKQKLSNELCRIITEPDPTVEQRRLYTNTDLIRIPVRCVFIMTAIEVPFNAIDILQRSVITKLYNNPHAPFESEWARTHLKKKGGREAWVAHHLLVLNCFMQTMKKVWDPSYKATHRLVNFEQTLITMGKTFGYDNVAELIPNYLQMSALQTSADQDFVLNALAAFANFWETNEVHGKKFGVKEINHWAEQNPEYGQTYVVKNAYQLSKYMQRTKRVITLTTGIVEAGKQNNRQVYQLDLTQKQIDK